MNIFEKYHSRKDESSAKWNLMSQHGFEVLDDVVPMSVADMEFELAPEIVEGLKDYISNTILGYTMPSESYFDSVINHYKNDYEVDIYKDHIVPVSGVVPALFYAVEAYTQAKDGVIIFTPVYPQFNLAISQRNREVVFCPLLLEEDKYHIDFDKFEELARDERNKMVILCSPHNPSGRIWNEEELIRVGQICKKHDLILICDEIHSDLGLNGRKVESIFHAVKDMDDKIVLMSAASKTYNLAGVQTANVIIKDEAMRKKFQDVLVSLGIHGPNMLGLKATELAYNHGQTWLSGALEVIERNFELTKEFFARYGLFWVYETEATYLAWLNFEEFCKKFDLHPKAFCEFLYESNFFVNPGIMFGEEGRYFARINLALPTHKYEENLQRLEKALRDRFQL